MTKTPSIGVIDLSMSGWTAGAVVSRTMALSLQAAGADVTFVTTRLENAPTGVAAVEAPKPFYLPGEWTFSKFSGLQQRSLNRAWARRAGIDVLLPDVEA